MHLPFWHTMGHSLSKQRIITVLVLYILSAYKWQFLAEHHVTGMHVGFFKQQCHFGEHYFDQHSRAYAPQLQKLSFGQLKYYYCVAIHVICLFNGFRLFLLQSDSEDSHAKRGNHSEQTLYSFCIMFISYLRHVPIFFSYGPECCNS